MACSANDDCLAMQSNHAFDPFGFLFTTTPAMFEISQLSFLPSYALLVESVRLFALRIPFSFIKLEFLPPFALRTAFPFSVVSVTSTTHMGVPLP